MTKTLLRTAALATASAAALLAAAPAYAQDSAVEEVVVTSRYVPSGETTASKAGTPLVEVPQAVTVISRAQIDLLDWNTLGQTVRYTAGVTGENYGPDERVDWLTVRGFNPVQYVDGLQSSIGSISNTGLDLYGAESVEVLKGPSSVLYGQTPPGGIVNVTMRRPKDQFGGEVEIQAGSNDHKQANFDVTGPAGDYVSGRLTALWRDRGTQVDGVDSERKFLASALTVRPSDATRVTLLSYIQQDKVTGDGGGFLPSFGMLKPNPVGKISASANLGETSYNRFKRNHWGIGYDAEHALNDSVTLQQNLKLSHIDSDQRGVGGNGFVDNDFNGVPDDYRTVNRYSFSFAEDVDTFAVDTRLKAKADTGALRHDIVAGVDYRRYDYVGSSAFGFGIPSIDIFKPVYNVFVPALPPMKFSDQLQKQTGLYVQDQLKLDKWIGTFALRQDWVDTKDRMANRTVKDDELSYRAGLSYDVGNGLIPYIAASKSFQPVAGSDRNGAVFQPTTGKQVEAGLKYQTNSLVDGLELFATLAAYQLTQENVLTADPVNIAFQIQTGEVEVKGFEAEVVGRYNEGLSFNAAYSNTDSEVTKSNGVDKGNRLPVTPRHKLSALVDYTFQNGALAGFGGSLGARYLSDTAGNLAASYQPIVFTNPSVTLWDATVHYEFNDWKVGVTASNLFDKAYVARCYSDANCFFGTTRVVTASLVRKF